MQGETCRISAKRKQRRRHKDKTTLPGERKYKVSLWPPRTRKRVFAGVAVKFADEVGALKTRGAQRLVKVEIVLRRIDDAPGNIGAVVGRALETGEKIGEDEAELNAAPALL